MANKLENTYRYTVRHSEGCCSVGIEASTAQEAIDLATKSFKDKKVLSVEAKPIYEAGIDVETDDGDDNDEAIFEIVIRGTDPKKVDALKHALGILIPGPHTGDEEEFKPNELDDVRPLVNILRDLFVNAY